MMFPADYFAARSAFRAAASAAGLTLESHPIAAPGPAGEPLTIDVAMRPAEAERAVVITSGLHGVEGFTGSAIQVALLERLATAAAPVRLVLIHALNPWGFAHLRRVDADNADLNRNFLLPGETYAGSPPLYATLDGLLNPPWPHSRWEPFLLKALWARLRYGIPALKHTIAFGQYDFKRGLYFGGMGPSETVRILQANLQRWLGNSRSALLLDIHTGVGPWAEGTVLLDEPIDAAAMASLRTNFGADRIEVANDRGVAFAVRGSLGPWCAASVPGVSWLYLCAEFGTYALIPVLAGLRAENQQHHWGKPADPATLHSKARLRELFFPTSESWRDRVLTQGVEFCDQAMRFAAATVDLHTKSW